MSSSTEQPHVPLPRNFKAEAKLGLREMLHIHFENRVEIIKDSCVNGRWLSPQKEAKVDDILKVCRHDVEALNLVRTFSGAELIMHGTDILVWEQRRLNTLLGDPPAPRHGMFSNQIYRVAYAVNFIYRHLVRETQELDPNAEMSDYITKGSDLIARSFASTRAASVRLTLKSWMEALAQIYACLISIFENFTPESDHHRLFVRAQNRITIELRKRDDKDRTTPLPLYQPRQEPLVEEPATLPPPAYHLGKAARDRCEVRLKGGHEQEMFMTSRMYVAGAVPTKVATKVVQLCGWLGWARPPAGSASRLRSW